MRLWLPVLLLALAQTSMADNPWDCRQDDSGRWICVPAKPPEQAAPETRQPESPAPETEQKAP